MCVKLDNYQESIKEVFLKHISTLQHVLLLLLRSTSNWLSISLHVFSSISSVIVAKASFILAFKFLISGIGVENTLSLTYPHKKKSRGVISGDRGGQGVGPSLLIHLFGNVASKNRRTSEPQCAGVPSFWKIIHGWNSSNWGYVCIPHCFLVINICNQGKTLCSPCTSIKTYRLYSWDLQILSS